MASSRVAQTWNPQRYLRFGSQRLRPALDLLGQIETGYDDDDDNDNDDDDDNRSRRRRMQIVDVGCGTGNITPFLRERWPQAKILCVDSSQEMLNQARKHHVAQGMIDMEMDVSSGNRYLEYQHSDFESFHRNMNTTMNITKDENEKNDDDDDDDDESAAAIDLIYSNSALHWVGFDIHQSLLPYYMSLLHPQKGILAFQIPDTRSQPSHLLMRQAMEECGYQTLNHTVRSVTTEVDPQEYYDLLKPHCSQINMWTTQYVHTMPPSESENPIADFTASTGLGPYLKALGGDTTQAGKAFIAKYRELILSKYPTQKYDGTTLFPFKRFFLIAQK